MENSVARQISEMACGLANSWTGYLAKIQTGDSDREWREDLLETQKKLQLLVDCASDEEISEAREITNANIPLKSHFPNLLKKAIAQYYFVIKNESLDDSVNIMYSQFCLYGGDTTCSLLEHYGKSLKSEIRKILEYGC